MTAMVDFFMRFTERELTCMVMLSVDCRAYRRVYQAFLRKGIGAARVWLSFLQWLGILTADRRAEIDSRAGAWY